MCNTRTDDNKPNNAKAREEIMSFEHHPKNRNLREWFVACPLGIQYFGVWVDALTTFLARPGMLEMRFGKGQWNVALKDKPIGTLIKIVVETLLSTTNAEIRLVVECNRQNVVLKHWRGSRGKQNQRGRGSIGAGKGTIRHNGNIVGANKRAKGQER